MDIPTISSDLITCHKHCEVRGFKKEAEWACGLLSSISDKSSLKLTSKAATNLSFNLEVLNNRYYRRAKNLYYLGQYKRAAFYLKDTKQTLSEQRCLYYHAQYMAIETDRLNMCAEGETVSATIKQVIQKVTDLLSELEKDIKRNKPDSWILCVYSKLLSKLNKVDQARDNLITAIRMEPLNWPAWDCLASLIIDRNHLNSIGIPNHWFGRFFAGAVYTRLQMFEEAYDLYHNHISEFFPTSAYVISQMAVAQNELRDIEAAVDSFKKVRSIDPFRLDDMAVYSNALYVSQRRYELASLAHSANEIEPFRYETCFCMANFYSLRAQHDKAAIYFARALKLDPTNVSAWILMGHEFMEMKKTEDAIKAYRSAINLDRSDPRAWYGLGQLYEILKLPNISLDHYLEAHKLKPNDSRFTIALADTYEKLEWHDQAITYYRRAGGAGLGKLATLLEKQGRVKEAVEAHKDFLEWLEQTEAFDPFDIEGSHANPEVTHSQEYIKQHETEQHQQQQHRQQV